MLYCGVWHARFRRRAVLERIFFSSLCGIEVKNGQNGKTKMMEVIESLLFGQWRVVRAEESNARNENTLISTSYFCAMGVRDGSGRRGWHVKVTNERTLCEESGCFRNISFEFVAREKPNWRETSCLDNHEICRYY